MLMAVLKQKLTTTGKESFSKILRTLSIFILGISERINWNHDNSKIKY